jgi:hypothetical protein
MACARARSDRHWRALLLLSGDAPAVFAVAGLSGAEPRELRPAEFGSFISSETNKWAKVVKLSGAKPE